MGAFSGRITNILKGIKENVALEGTTFETTKENMLRFRTWWKRINIEHGLVFWLTGAFTMLMLSLLAFTTVYGNPGVETSINFVIGEATAIAQKTSPYFGRFFLVMVGIMLFRTQFSVYGSNSKIAAENRVIMNQEKFKIGNIAKYFYVFLWAQLIAGMLILASGFTEPLALVTLGAVLNAISMFIYTGLVLWLNSTLLPKGTRPSPFRFVFVFLAFLFYGGFSVFTVFNFFG